MHRSSTSAVRLLAAWQQQRRELSDRLETLLLHGPTAVDRVAARADELRAALAAEQRAFEAFVAGAASREPAPEPEPARAAAPAATARPAPVPPTVYPPLRAVGPTA